ncbi:MAG: cation diffusion facilitator family transporter [Gemmatimonadaceae bacterium]
MNIGQQFDFPEQQQRDLRRARRLSWLTIVLLLTTAVLMFITLGQSQAMKTAWAEDLLGLIPPTALLVAMRFENRRPSKRFPYGYFRVISIAFLAAASALSTVGLWLLLDSVMKLVKQERPPIGLMKVFGHTLWAGWAMIIALIYATAVGLTLGLVKRPLAKRLGDKVIEADADMNKADWTSQSAAIIGILLVGFGFWRGDSLAAALISVSILHDGWSNLRQVVADLMDESPTVLGRSRKLEELPEKLRAAAQQLDWVESVGVRLREQGRLLTGEVFVVPRDGATMSAKELLAKAVDACHRLSDHDWRLHGISVVPVAKLDGEMPPTASTHGETDKGDSPLGDGKSYPG